MSTYNSSEYNCECEFEVPIKLNVPVRINPILSITPVGPVKEDLNALIGTNIHISPEVAATKPTCLPKYVYPKNGLPAA